MNAAVGGLLQQGSPRLRRAAVDAALWCVLAEQQANAGARLLALWGSEVGARRWVSVVYLQTNELLLVELPLSAERPEFPDLSRWFHCAARLQRGCADLTGLAADGGDRRRWLRHASWGADDYPLRADFAPPALNAEADADYPFVLVEGQGVHEIAVGPVHAGIIEPGHFRFSVVGEKVLRLEQRLGYTHKGIERGLQQLALVDGQRLVGRVSGDATVAYAWAYCQALEHLLGVTPSPRASALRGLALERERIANHLGDLGALGNDAGFGVGLTQFLRLKERLLRLNQALFGRRYLFDFVVPGGVAGDLDAAGIAALRQQGAELAAEVGRLREIYDNHAGLQDRFVDCGRLGVELAVKLGVLGLAARASGQDIDARRDFPVAPYDALPIAIAVRRGGDVAARVALRFAELAASLAWCEALLAALPMGALRQPLPAAAAAGAIGIGLIESWRGPVLVALLAGADGRIARCHPHDPSWQNWPALEHAVIGNIVPDFPLINKSFNLSYSGHDL